MMENKVMQLRGNKADAPKREPEEKFSFEKLRNSILSIEEMYTDHSLQFQREWDYKHVRDLVRQNIMTATSIDDLQQCLLRLEQGFSEPHSLRYINKGENQ